MKKSKKKLLILGLSLSLAFGLSACGNKKIFDTTYTFDRAIIKLANDEIIEIEIKVWTDYDGEQLQIVAKDETVYLVSSYRCDLIKD